MTTIRRYALLALCAVLLLAIAATCGYCARDRRAREDAAQAQAAARRASDEAALRASGAIVAERVSREAARHAAEALADQIAALRAAAPTVEVREVTRWQTATVPASCPVEPPVVAGCGVPTRPCVLRVGDPVEVRGVEATVETASGARALAGSAEVWSGTRRIASAPFSDGHYLVAEADLPAQNMPPKLRLYTGLGLGVLQVGDQTAAAYAAVVVGPGISGSRWRPWAHAALGAGTVEIGGERRRPWSVTGGVGRDW